jgi:hypothetical protein
LINCRLIGVTQLPVVLVRVRDECVEDVIELIWMYIENYLGVELLSDSAVEQLIITTESKVDSIQQSTKGDQ